METIQFTFTNQQYYQDKKPVKIKDKVAALSKTTEEFDEFMNYLDTVPLKTNTMDICTKKQRSKRFTDIASEISYRMNTGHKISKLIQIIYQRHGSMLMTKSTVQEVMLEVGYKINDVHSNGILKYGKYFKYFVVEPYYISLSPLFFNCGV